jgi:hypothetical protein
MRPGVQKTLKLTASLAVTVLFSWWAFRDTDWGQQWASLRSANYLWLLPYTAVLLGIHLCRTLRWGCLLSGIERVPFKPLHEASGIGFMLLLVLPFRLGEFARPVLIAQRTGIRRSAAMATVVLERIVDGIAIAVLLRVLLFFVPVQGDQVGLIQTAANLMFAVFGGGLLFLLFGLWQQRRAVALVRGTLGRVAPNLGEKVAGMIDTFVGALRMLPGWRQTAGFFGLTALYWALNGYGMSLLTRAFDCSAAVDPTCQPLHLGFGQGFVVLCVLIVGIMIPAAPGMMGTFQWAVKLGLGLFLPAQVINASGLAYANVMWLAQTLQQVLVGMVLLALSPVSFREITGKLSSDAESPVAPEPVAESRSSVA